MATRWRDLLNHSVWGECEHVSYSQSFKISHSGKPLTNINNEKNIFETVILKTCCLQGALYFEVIELQLFKLTVSIKD